MSNAEFSQELDEQQLIFRQIERYQKTWNKMEETRHKDSMGKVTKENNLKVVHSQAWKHAQGLKSLIKPKLSGDETENLEDLGGPEDPEPLFDKCLQLLYDQNLMWENNSDFIVEDRTDSKVEPEDSKVSEEVV